MNFLFHLRGADELKASRGHVPEAFYEAVQQVGTDDFVHAYDGGFVHSVEMHDRLYKPNTFSSYVIFRFVIAPNSELGTDLLQEVILKLKETNFARPVESHHHYQVFSMETIDTSFDDD